MKKIKILMRIALPITACIISMNHVLWVLDKMSFEDMLFQNCFLYPALIMLFILNCDVDKR